MNSGPDLDLLELHRQLTDLAESGGPWDDPMPEVRRRAVMTPTPTRVPRRWLPASVSPLTLGSAAAAVLVVAGVGWLIHGTPGADKKSASADSLTSAAAAAGGNSAAASRPQATRRLSVPPAPSTAASRASASTVAAPHPGGPVACVSGTVSPALVLTAPSEISVGARVQASVRAGGSVQGAPPIILVRSGSQVVGRLVPAAAVPGTHPTPPLRVNEAVTPIVGTLQRVAAVCGRSPARTIPAVTPDALGPLPAGRYQLVAVSYLHGSFVLSAPVNLVVSR